jgi:sugar-phosphatase
LIVYIWAIVFETGKAPLSAPISVLNVAYRAFLFDMDGTILTSIKAAERVWGNWAAGHGLDVEAFLPTIHGPAPSTPSIAWPAGVDAEAEAVDHRGGTRGCRRR